MLCYVMILPIRRANYQAIVWNKALNHVLLSQSLKTADGTTVKAF